MKIEITKMAITQRGTFDKGDILTSDKFPVSFLYHLAGDCNAAEIIEYDTKVDPERETPAKKPQSSQLSRPDRASQKPTASSRKPKPQSSQ